MSEQVAKSGPLFGSPYGYRNPRPAMRAKIVNGLHAIGQQLLAIV